MTQKVYRLINASILGASSTSKVKVSLNDTTENYLSAKIEAGTGITTTITNPVGDEKLEISADAANIDHNSLQNYEVDEHRLLDDAQTTATNLWSASKINTQLSTKADLVDGVVPASQLPSYVDDVLEFADFASFPVEGETGKIYVALDSNKTYRWSGSTYIQIASGGVKVSSNDTTEGFLEDKVVGASGKIVISTLQEGADEDLQISIGADVFDKTVNTTDNISEGSTNVFFTEQRAKDAAVSNAIVEGVTNVAPSQDAVFQALASASESLSNHIDQETGAHAASAISFDDQVSELDAEDVQAAIEKLSENDDLKVAKAGDTMTGTLQFEVTQEAPFSAIEITKSNETETTDQAFVEYNYVGFEKLQDSEIVQFGALDAYTLYIESYENGVTTKKTNISSSKLLINKENTDVDGPGFNIETVDGQILLETKVGANLQPSSPSSSSHVTNKNYVDNTVNTIVNTAISQLDLKLKTPQVLYVNKNPGSLSYIPDGSIHKPYLTIKDAIDYAAITASASNKFCIVIAPGTYNELNTIRLKGYVDLTSYVNDTVIITVAGGSRLLWSNNSPGRVFISNISISNGVEVLNDNPTGTSGCVLDLDNVDTGTVIFNGRGGGRDFIQLRNDTRLNGSCTINSAATTIFDSTIIGNLNLTDIGCVAPDGFGSAITATLRSNYQLNVNITSTSFDIYVDAWGNNNVSTLTMTSNSAIPSTFNSDAISYPNTITLSGSPTPVVARTTQARSISVNAINGISSTNVQSALEELKLGISSVGSSGDIAESSTSFLNNVSTPDNVVGLAFSAAVVSSFEAQVVVSRGTKKEVFSLLGVQTDGDFSMSVESIGVNTGIDFTISDVGQVKYTSTDDVDGGTIKFRAITLTV
jgi:hypothetical protein